jgi:hypothetical protein
MAEKKAPPESSPSKPPAADAPPQRKSRKHGYRGYGSGLGKDPASYGGRVHWGTGFAGVEPLSGKRDGFLDANLLDDKEKEDSKPEK